MIDQGTLLDRVDWNVEQMGGEIRGAVEELKEATRLVRSSSLPLTREADLCPEQVPTSLGKMSTDLLAASPHLGVHHHHPLPPCPFVCFDAFAASTDTSGRRGTGRSSARETEAGRQTRAGGSIREGRKAEERLARQEGKGGDAGREAVQADRRLDGFSWQGSANI